jgi:hypothetical protein
MFEYYCIILNEENFLAGKFGTNFKTFTDSVNRFTPSFKSLPDEILSHLPFDLKSGLVSEKRSIQAFVISAFVIVAGYLLKSYLK